MERTINRPNWIQYSTAILVILSLLLSFGAYTNTEDVDYDKITAISEAAQKDVVVNNNNTKLDELYSDYFEEDEWENEAVDIATDEWSKRDFKEIYDALDDLYNDIDDRDDIEYVVLREEEVTNSDVDDSDATVVQEVKVRYENDSGDNVKRYLTITTDIEDSEIEDQDIEETL